MRRLPVGSRVIVRSLSDWGTMQERGAVVVKHGRDAAGIYTEVAFDDGHAEQHHRDNLRPWMASNASAAQRPPDSSVAETPEEEH